MVEDQCDSELFEEFKRYTSKLGSVQLYQIIIQGLFKDNFLIFQGLKITFTLKARTRREGDSLWVKLSNNVPLRTSCLFVCLFVFVFVFVFTVIKIYIYICTFLD